MHPCCATGRQPWQHARAHADAARTEGARMQTPGCKPKSSGLPARAASARARRRSWRPRRPRGWRRRRRRGSGACARRPPATTWATILGRAARTTRSRPSLRAATPRAARSGGGCTLPGRLVRAAEGLRMSNVTSLLGVPLDLHHWPGASMPRADGQGAHAFWHGPVGNLGEAHSL